MTHISDAFKRRFQSHLTSLRELNREGLLVLSSQYFEVPPDVDDDEQRIRHVLALKLTADESRRLGEPVDPEFLLALTFVKERPCLNRPHA